MNFFEAIILGFVQSMTEFFPISSSAHLIILPKIFGWDAQPLVFDLVLHLGTTFSLLFFFRKDLLIILKSLWEDTIVTKFQKNFSEFSSNSKLAFYLLVATIPAVVLGLVFGDWIEENTRDLGYILVFLTLGTVLMIWAEVVARKKTNFSEMGFFRATVIGIFQSLALFPGFSRSGSTISGGMISGMSRLESVKFAFLMAIPVIIGASGVKIIKDFTKIFEYPFESLSLFLSSFLFGLVALNLLTLFLKKGTLKPFIIYRIILIVFLFFYINNR
jgi:undecaprenyl-diphosphatase